ncbi:ThuA domain-containing protein [Paenibacillus tarimensis]
MLKNKKITSLFLLIMIFGLATNVSALDKPAFRVLVFTKTAAFVHDSIPDAVAAVRRLAAENNFTADVTDDAGAFTDANLAKYDAVVFLLTTGDVLNESQQTAFERYLSAGHGYAGVHSASDTEHDWPWYGRLVGAYFKNHSDVVKATIVVEDPSHPSTSFLPKRWERIDEWYNYKSNPRSNVHVLLNMDESTYQGGEMGADHPIAWCSRFSGGRSWYTGLGHTKESYSEPLFLRHLLGGIQWAAGVKEGYCGEKTK